MASPFALPGAIPPPLAAGHSFSVPLRGRARERDQGERRVRPRFRSKPEEVDVSWLLTQAEFDALDVFFNETIQGGASDFDAQVHLRGTEFEREWFTCQWIGAYEWAVDFASADGLTFRVRTRLRLLASLGADRVAPGILASGVDVDRGGARFRTVGRLRASGVDVDRGGATFEGRGIFSGGVDEDDGGWFTGIVTAVNRVTEAGVERRLEQSAGIRETE